MHMHVQWGSYEQMVTPFHTTGLRFNVTTSVSVKTFEEKKKSSKRDESVLPFG